MHGNVVDWDYFRGRPYSDPYGNALGLARAGGIIRRIRRLKGAESVVVVDNGDTIQGTPLTYYYSRVEPITATGLDHPVAVACNAIGFDAAAVGNHEFNYGLELLDAYEQDLDFPLLGANVLDALTGEPMFQPYTLLRRDLGVGPVVRIGLLGLTTPGSMVWDRQVLEGRARIEDMATSAAEWVPRILAAGADLVVVLCHAGIGHSSYAVDGLGPENAAELVAQVPGIDAIVLGHTHATIEQAWVTNTTTGRDVLLTQPRHGAQQVAEITFRLGEVGGRWRVESTRATLHEASRAEADPAVLRAVQPYHDAAVAYVDRVVATCTQELSAATSHYRDTPILDFVQVVQTRTVARALADGPCARLPLLSVVAPFNRSAVLPRGQVTIRDMAALYSFDNTLQAVLLTGAQVRDYLEFSAKYYATVPAGLPFDPQVHTSVVHDGLRVWDYNYDILSGVDYRIDLSQPVGSRIVGLTRDGEPVADDQRFVVALNSYRRAGGGNFPHVSTAPVVYDEQQEIRQLMIDWATARGTIDPAEFFRPNWALVVDGRPAP